MIEEYSLKQVGIINTLEQFAEAQHITFDFLDDSIKTFDPNHIQIAESHFIVIPFQKVVEPLPDHMTIAALLPRQNVQKALDIKNEYLDMSLDLRITKAAKVFCKNSIDKCQLLNIRPDLEFVDNQKLSDGMISFKTDLTNDGYSQVVLHPDEMVPDVSSGIYACICLTDDVNTRRKVKQIHDVTTTNCSNAERELSNLLTEYPLKAIHCHVDKRMNYQLQIAIVDNKGNLHKEKISQSTSYQIAKAMHLILIKILN